MKVGIPHSVEEQGDTEAEGRDADDPRRFAKPPSMNPTRFARSL
jgi:hypothetical protein